MSLPNKIHLAQNDYFIVQNIYRGWAWLGVVLIGALLINLALTVMTRGKRPFPFVLANLLCLAASLAIFFIFTFPTNVATNNWTEIPANWQHLRWQWEISHAANCAVTFVGFCSLTMSLLVARE